MARLSSAINHVLEERVPPMVFALTRGSSGPSEAVLPYNTGRLDLGPALGKLASGHYVVNLAKIERAGVTMAPLRLDLDWNPPSGQTVATVTPGVYSLRVFTADDGYDIGSTVAVLIADAARYEQSSSRFRELKEASEAWNDQIRPTTLHYIWTLYLFDLAEKSGSGRHE
jgi:hypothetical protein